MIIKFLKRPSLGIYISNLAIRGLTIGAKFSLTFFIGREYKEEFLGEYGLFSTSILLAYFILSLSFDSYGLREIIEKPVGQHLTYIRNLFVFYVIAFLLFIPASITLFEFDFLPHDLLIYFLGLLFFETLNQVFFALFTIIQKSTIANIVLFLSQGLWIIFIFILWFLTPIKFHSLENFLFAWLISSAIASVYAFLMLAKIYDVKSLHSAVDWKWIKMGLSVSLIYFCSTLAYKLIEFTDRYAIEFQLGSAKLGVYVFFSQLANLINTVINVVVIVILYPKLIVNHLNDDLQAFIAIKNKMYSRVLVIGLLIGLLEVSTINYLLEILGKKSFENEVHILYVLILSNIAMNLSFIPHYCLYALKRDLILLYTTLSGTICSIFLNFLLIPIFGLTGAALATFSSFLLVWVTKSLYLKKNLSLIGK